MNVGQKRLLLIVQQYNQLNNTAGKWPAPANKLDPKLLRMDKFKQ